MPLSDSAKAMFGWNDESRHACTEVVVEGNTFRVPCRCGYQGKPVTSSPSHAYNSTKVHAETENRREAAGGQKVEADYTRTGEPPRAVVRRSAPSRPTTAPRRASQGTPGTPCGCGCGEPSGGLFRPGHDSKLLSRLLGEIRGGRMTLLASLAPYLGTRVVEVGAGTGSFSEMLRDKLAKKVNA